MADDGPRNDDTADLIARQIRGDLPLPPVARLVGFRVVSAGSGSAVTEMQADQRHTNPMGTLHGGILCDLADGAMGYAMAASLDRGQSFTTLEMKINFLKPIWTGRLTARAQVKKSGRTTALLDCEIRDEKGSLVAFATSTCMVLRGEASRGR